MYYPINENTARTAKHMNSFSDYIEGSATEEYRRMVDKATDIAARQKDKVDTMYHGAIDALLDRYARKLADNLNKGYSIETRCPSVLIAGPSNFPVRKKEKQNAARDRNMEEYNHIQGLLDKIQSTGMGGISSDDPQAIEKLKEKLVRLEADQQAMKDVNAYYRKNKTLDGCQTISREIAEKLKADMSRRNEWGQGGVPFEGYGLSNNNANIKSIRERITELEKRSESAFTGWTFGGGEVIANTAENRLQIVFDEKPDEELRGELKSRGFRWAPSQGAWQRQLTDNAIYSAKRIPALQPNQ